VSRVFYDLVEILIPDLRLEIQWLVALRRRRSSSGQASNDWLEKTCLDEAAPFEAQDKQKLGVGTTSQYSSGSHGPTGSCAGDSAQTM
jgi:hypothetical protein